MDVRKIFNISAALLLAGMFAFGVSGLVQFFQDLLLQDLSGQVGVRSTDETITVDPILLPLINSMQNKLLSERPQFEGMLNLENIRQGMFIYEYGNGYEMEVLVVNPPYMLEGQCRYDAIHLIDGRPAYLADSYCSDMGLVEYSGILKGWNPTNHIVWSGKPDLSQEEIDALLELLVSPEPIYDFGDQDL